jgi:acyl-CoA synthetase (AMP-forming)/AMP-acid ligase II
VGDRDRAGTLAGLLRTLTERGTADALIEADTGRRIGAAELAAAVVAESARRRADPVGGTLALSGPNSAAWLRTMLGTAAAGRTVATINPLGTADDITDQLRRARARTLVCDSAVADRLGEVAPAGVEVERLEHEQPRPGPEVVPVGAVEPAGDFTLMTSSGTTGSPKTARMTDSTFAISSALLAGHWGLGPDDTYLAVLPLSHAAGLAGTMSALGAGSRVVTMPRFEPAAFLRALEAHRVTAALLAPPILRLLAQHPAVDEHDLSALRVLASAGAPLPAEVAEACERRLDVAVCNAYGMTETGWIALDSAAAPRRPGTVGKPVEDLELRLVDPETGRDVPAGTAGEIWVRGPGTSPGYLEDPAASAALLSPDGWSRTGDLAVLDDDGRIRIVDRLKDLIKYNGHQVAPAVLERLIVSRADIADVAVAGLPDPDAGELPHAFVVAADGLDPEELMAWVAERVAPHQRVRGVSVVDEIPRLPAGKILRRLLPVPT